MVSKSGLKSIPLVEGKPKVVIKGGKDVYSLVKEAFHLLDIGQVIKPKDKVLIKPNFTGLAGRGVITSPEVLKAVVEAVFNHTEAGDIIIGEGSGACQTWEAFMKYGVVDFAMKLRPKIQLIDFNWDKALQVDVPKPFVMKSIWVAETALKADVVVSVPALKNWGMTAVSLGLKNMWGIVPVGYGKRKPWGRSLLPHGKTGKDGKPDPSDTIYGQSIQGSGVTVDICQVVKPNITVIDALTVNDGYGREISTREFGRIIAGLDPVAVDTVGSAVMCFDPKKILHLNMAADRGLGTNNMDEIIVEGESVEDIRFPCNPIAGMEAIRQFLKERQLRLG